MNSWSPLVFGTDSLPAALTALRAGPLTAWFDPGTLFLRRISLGGDEVVRAIYIAVRDRNWGTIPAKVLRLEQVQSDRAFRVVLDVESRAEPIHFRWHGVFAGDEKGVITCEFEGRAKSTFLRNRIGFCVLHPIACAGARARVEQVDGSAAALGFPDSIEPQILGRATFHDLRSLAHELAPGVWGKVTFSGDTFETEDQRNWTDASFKTYCTPLAIPFPVEVKAGTLVRQGVRLQLQGEAPAIEPSFTTVDECVVPSAPSAILPKIGTSMPAGAVASGANIAALRSLGLKHLRVDLFLPEDRAPDERTLRCAQGLGARLELVLHYATPDELVTFASDFESYAQCVARILVFRTGESATSPESLLQARGALGRWGIPIGAGTDAHFCELNREQALGRFDPSLADFVAWPVTPQVHAFDDLSIIENLEAQAHTVAAARDFSGGKPLCISPLTLKPRFNAVATDSERRCSRPTPETDCRQHSGFAAAWTLGSIAALSATRLDSLTLYELCGPRGILPGTGNAPDMESPTAQVVMALAGVSAVHPMVVPNRFAALFLYSKGRLAKGLIANLQRSESTLRIQHPALNPTAISLGPQAVEVLDSASPFFHLRLPPYGLCQAQFECVAARTESPV